MIRAWVKLMWNAAVVGAVAAAAQLGVADMLGIIRWDGGDAPVRTSDWSALLTWVGFSFTVAVLTGALAGRRAVPRRDGRDGIGARITAALMAALGAAGAIALAWLPAQDADPPVRVDPDLVVAITAGAGVLVGLVIALIALSAPPVALGLRTAITWIWLVGIGSAAVGISTHQPYPPPRLAVLDAPSLVTAAWWTGPQLMIGVAAALGLVVAGVTRWRGAGRLGVALSGFAGPAVVAGAYLIAGPGVGADRAAQYEPYLAALIATGAGLLASVVVAMPGRRRRRPERDDLDIGPLSGDLLGAEPPFPGAPTATEPGRFGSAYTHPDPAAGQTLPHQPARQTGEPAWPSEPAKPAWRGSTQPDLPQATPRHTGSRESTGSTFTDTTYGAGAYSGGAYEGGGYEGGAYEGGSYGSPATSVAPVMGQPADDDPHSTWLRDLGPSGRHGR